MAGELGVALDAADRTDLGEQLGSGDRAATGEVEQCRCERGGALFEFLVEFGDLAVEPPVTPLLRVCRSSIGLGRCMLRDRSSRAAAYLIGALRCLVGAENSVTAPEAASEIRSLTG